MLLPLLTSLIVLNTIQAKKHYLIETENKKVQRRVNAVIHLLYNIAAAVVICYITIYLFTKQIIYRL